MKYLLVLLLFPGFLISNAEYLNLSEFNFDLSSASPVMGDLETPVTIIEFGDYQCPNCQKWFKSTKPAIVENYIDVGKVNLVFVDLAFLGQDSVLAAEASHCAEDQGKFWKYHDILYNNAAGIDNGWASPENLVIFAKSAELDVEQFQECIESAKYNQRVESNYGEAVKQQVQGTPTFFIINTNGESEKIGGPQPYPIFEKVIDSLLIDKLQLKETSESIPIWIKNNARWWADGQIEDSDFVSGIQFLISNGIMNIPQTQAGKPTEDEIPIWIKNNARWWADGQIEDSDFVSGIQFLISNGIMNIPQTPSEENSGYVRGK